MIDVAKVKHVLISRTDNIGDVVLTLPMATVIKQAYPDIKVSFLVREYTADLVRLHPDVDGVIAWDGLNEMSEKEAVAYLKDNKIDCVIHVFPRSKIARLMSRAGVQFRIGTWHRLFHLWTCNQFVNLSRAKSQAHEALLNLKLLAPLGIDMQCDLDELSSLITLKSDGLLSDRLQLFLHPNKFNLIIHPFTNGNTQEWPISHFNALIRQLPKDQFHILITGSEKEVPAIKQRIMTQCPDVVNVAGQCSLSELLQLISHADGLVANSTGPMHIAAAVGIRTLGLFPSGAGTDGVNRWQPLGKKAVYLAADPNCQSPRCRAHPQCLCMESITVGQVKEVIMGWLSSVS